MSRSQVAASEGQQEVIAIRLTRATRLWSRSPTAGRAVAHIDETPMEEGSSRAPTLEDLEGSCGFTRSGADRRSDDHASPSTDARSSAHRSSNEIHPAASTAYLAWSQNSGSHPNHYDLFARPVGDPRFRVNPPGTGGLLLRSMARRSPTSKSRGGPRISSSSTCWPGLVRTRRQVSTPLRGNPYRVSRVTGSCSGAAGRLTAAFNGSCSGTWSRVNNDCWSRAMGSSDGLSRER